MKENLLTTPGGAGIIIIVLFFFCFSNIGLKDQPVSFSSHFRISNCRATNLDRITYTPKPSVFIYSLMCNHETGLKRRLVKRG
jgi:hypothetical protein